MKTTKAPKTQTGNIKFKREERNNNFASLSTYHLQDNRLNTTEQLIFTKLLILPPNFKISIRKTATYLNVSAKTFQRAIESFKKYGYLEIKRKNQNESIYQINEISKSQSEFNIYYLANYSISQLNYFLKNTTTPPKYKKVIKLYLNKLSEFEAERDKLIAEADNEPF